MLEPRELQQSHARTNSAQVADIINNLHKNVTFLPNRPRLPAGFMHHHTTTKNGQRWSTSKGYLRGASRRHNLDIVVRAPVTRVIIDPETRRALGVVFFKGSKRYVVWARKEVILSAGAFKTPQLLKLSGVGSCHELEKFKVS